MIERVRIRPNLGRQRTSTISILDAVNDPALFGPWFKRADTWRAWFTFLAALFALPMTRDQLALYRECTGRKHTPKQPASEGWLVCGRRAGKSFILALCAVFLACFFDYRQHLAAGERGTVLVIATDRRQARVIFRYVRALLINVPMLARMVQRETADTFDLSNRVSIEISTASFRSTRGYTIVAALCDELAFWNTDDSAQPDFEVLNAIRPGMSTIPGAMLLCASSPYARKGALWSAYRKHFGREHDPILVWQAPTRTMNATVPQSVVDEAMERDPASAQAEYLAQFRTDVEAFVAREAVEACTSLGVRERPRVGGITYRAFVDPSGGSADSMTLAVGHRENNLAVLDALRERRPPFSPDDVVAEFATLLRSYGIHRVTGDRYGGEWCREPFRKSGITYEVGSKPKSDLYRDMLPLINSKRVDLLEHDRLVMQLVGLERRTARSGRDSIDHGPGGHDDLSNVVAGVCSLVSPSAGTYDINGFFRNEDGTLDTNIDWLAERRNRFMLSGGLRR
jgi:hypothetical protein